MFSCTVLRAANRTRCSRGTATARSSTSSNTPTSPSTRTNRTSSSATSRFGVCNIKFNLIARIGWRTFKLPYFFVHRSSTRTCTVVRRPASQVVTLSSSRSLLTVSVSLVPTQPFFYSPSCCFRPSQHRPHRPRPLADRRRQQVGVAALSHHGHPRASRDVAQERKSYRPFAQQPRSLG